MNLKKILDGFAFGEKQEVGVMSVIPLLDKDATNSLASFEDVEFLKTTDYGNMVFKNNTDKPFIIPTGYSVITPQAAQDHGLTSAHLLQPQEYRDIDGACCIEQTQGGYIDGRSVKDFHLLPLYVRKNHFNRNMRVRGNDSTQHLHMMDDCFSRLWPIISEFQSNLVQKNEAHIVYFFNKFVDKLNQFNAEFEVVEGQRGAIIMLNNEIVGIEVAPTQEYWNVIWHKLIRDCYGSEVVRLTMSNLIKEFKEHHDSSLSLEEAATIEDIRSKLEDYQQKEQQKVMEALEELLHLDVILANNDQSFVKSNEYNNIKYHMFKVKNKKTYGEVYTEEDKVIYASVVL